MLFIACIIAHVQRLIPSRADSEYQRPDVRLRLDRMARRRMELGAGGLLGNHGTRVFVRGSTG